MRIGTFYNVLLCALRNNEIDSIDAGMKLLADMGISYYEVYADTIISKRDEMALLSALQKNQCYIGNLYFKKELNSTDEDSIDNLLEYSKGIIEQCTRINCGKIMPVITVNSDDEKASELVHDYYKTVSEISDRYGILTVFENNTNADTKCFTLDDVKRLMKDSDKLAYLIDTGNFWFSKESTSSAINQYKDKISGVHLKDILPEKDSTPDDADIKVRYATLGQGVSSIDKCIKLLKKCGYNKEFTIEIDNSDPILPRIQKSVEIIKQSADELLLVSVAEDYHELLFRYAQDYEKLGDEIELKTMHMLSVASLMNNMAVKLHIDSRMHRLAIITGLFHDIGRYEQFRNYHTFRDSISADHADLSVEILKRENLLSGFSETDRDMILTAIKNHNKYRIESGLDEETLLLCKMIRDADKIDCFRVVSTEPFETSYAVTEKELEESEISQEVFESIMNHQMIKNTDRKHPLDYILSCCAFVFDINFAASREIVLKKDKYLCRLNELSFRNAETVRTLEKIIMEIKAYLNQG